MPGFKYNISEGIGYYTIDSFEETGKVKTCFSSRVGGVSTDEYACMNLGYKSGDTSSNIDKNISVLCKSTGIRLEDLVLSDQIHSDKCKIVGSGDRGKGIFKDSDIVGVDALITNNKNTAICIFTADCLPVFLFDTINEVIAVCHAGWRGIVNEILIKSINIMCTNFGSKPEHILAAIGPSIGPCCFSVGEEVITEFRKVFENIDCLVTKDNNKCSINLWNAGIEQLVTSGIFRSNITNSQLCTSCNSNHFYSYRRDNSKTGRMISILQLR
jgi:polyphenol oxidase